MSNLFFSDNANIENIRIDFILNIGVLFSFFLRELTFEFKVKFTLKRI